MPVEETMWDVFVSRNLLDRRDEQLRTVLAGVIAERLPRNKKLLRVVAWSPNGGCLFAPKAGVHRFAVTYEVQLPHSAVSDKARHWALLPGVAARAS
jgi:hypothetical protein